jgi:hypothetical protein
MERDATPTTVTAIIYLSILYFYRSKPEFGF